MLRLRSLDRAGKATKIRREIDDPTPFLSEQANLLDQIKTEWDLAERNIKKAENVQGELCLPAVNELRYAGRRLIDAWEAIRLNDKAEAIAKINDAKFDCYRARHDSVDAISSKVAKDVEITVETFGLEVVVRAFPAYSDLLHKLFFIQSKIESSRGDRKDRAKIYGTIESIDIDALVEDYRRFRTAESVMVKLAEDAKMDKSERNFYEHGGLWVGVLGVLFAIISFIISFMK